MIDMIIAGAIFLIIAAFVAWLNFGKIARARRSLPIDKQDLLAKEDAKWLQDYGF